MDCAGRVLLDDVPDEEGIDVSDDVIDYIASHVESNIRELEGTLTRLSAQCQLMGTTITL